MNYAAIYAAFIADRRTKEAALKASGQYSEKHHVQPSAKGGSDAPENLIALTPEDHFFAHLLLAKIYGGKMWLAVVLMTASHSRCYGQSRKLHGFAARAAQKNKAPDEITKAKMLATQQARAPRFVFVHQASGEKFDGTAFRFGQHSGMKPGEVSKLVTGLIRTSKGWTLETNARAHKGARDLAIRIFRHKDGREFEGTAYQFRQTFDADAGLVSRMIKNSNRGVKGWRHAGEKEA